MLKLRAFGEFNDRHMRLLTFTPVPGAYQLFLDKGGRALWLQHKPRCPHGGSQIIVASGLHLDGVNHIRDADLSTML